MKHSNRLLTLCVLGVILLAAACDKDYKAEVQSDTSWSGSFGGKSLDGRNDQVIDIPDDGYQCCIVQKNTEDGYLRLRVYDESSGTPTNVWEETTDVYGHVKWCKDLSD